MRPNIRKITNIIERLKDEQHLQYSFLQNADDFYYFISPNIVNYKIEEFGGFKSLLSMFIVRDKGSNDVLGYRIRPKRKFVFNKNYLLINASDDVYMATGFPGIQCYFSHDSIMLISSKRTGYYDSIESIL